MFPIPFNFPFRKSDGSVTSIGSAIESGGGSYTLPTASASTKGGVKIGVGLTMDGETLNNSNPTPFTLPTASDETLGGVKVGDGLSIDDNGILSAIGGGGSSLHMYEVTTNQLVAQKMFVLTTVEDNITNYTKLKTALTTGIGFIVSGGVTGSGYAPVYARFLGGASTLITTYAIKNSPDQDMWAISSIMDTATVSSTKIF